MLKFDTQELPATLKLNGEFNVDQLIELGRQLARLKLAKGEYLTKPDAVRRLLQSSIGTLEYEAFVVIHLNSQQQVLAYTELFRGTIDAASIYTREVVKDALKHNAGAVIFAHNHPSGSVKESAADRRITQRLIAALKTVDIPVLDHLIVSPDDFLSFAEKGFLN